MCKGDVRELLQHNRTLEKRSAVRPTARAAVSGAMMDKRCGTCALWEIAEAKRHKGLGYCIAPIPSSAMMPDTDMMAPNEGTECPCWEAKE